MIWIECGAVALIAVLATIAFTPFAKWLARRTDAIDYPDNRRVNTSPTPRMGGVAMLLGMLVASIAILIGISQYGWIDPFDSPTDTNMTVNFPLLALGVVTMFGVGVYDDIKNMRAPIKFLLQLVSCFIVAASGLLLTEIQNPFAEGFIEFGWFAYPITAIYLVCFANVINLIDGLDGLASGISAISAATIFTFSVFSGRYEAAIICAIIVGVCIGFLCFNRHPASIFMGDSGSLLLGLMLGIASLMAVARSTLFISLLVPILAAGVPIMDTAAAIIRRKRAHQRIDEPDRGHIHHRLLDAGFSQDSTVMIMWMWTCALAICSIILSETEGIPRTAAIIIAAIITGFAIYKLKLLDPVLQHYFNPRQMKQGQTDEGIDATEQGDGSGDRHNGVRNDSRARTSASFEIDRKGNDGRRR